MTALDTFSAEEVIRALELTPHPEGGFYRETFRDRTTAPASTRAASTAIYFLLPAGVVSRWHKVDATEIWHWYAGAPLELQVATETDGTAISHLGNELDLGQKPQVIVPAHAWQQARSLGAWTLTGCTVAPGFTFDGFTMAAAGWKPTR